MRCDECGIIIYKTDAVETIDGKILCYGCDAKRLEKENSVYINEG